jgi:hypothetical protein
VSISDWLDEKEAEGIDVSHIVLPDDLFYDEAPDETIYFKEINPCGIFCTGNHPFSTVERFGHWYYCRGQDKRPVFTLREWNGGRLPRIETSPSRKLNHTWSRLLNVAHRYFFGGTMVLMGNGNGGSKGSMP